MQQINQQKLVEYWTEASNDDLQSSIDIIANTKSYIQGLFFLHLSLEKLLKALFVQTHGDHAPLSHNLLGLISKCGIEIVDQNYEFTFVEINQYNIEMRYPDDIKSLKKKA